MDKIETTPSRDDNIPIINSSSYNDEKISPTILSLIIILLFLQLVAVIFPLIVQKKEYSIEKKNIQP